jgi:hypothetical protein
VINVLKFILYSLIVQQDIDYYAVYAISQKVVKRSPLLDKAARHGVSPKREQAAGFSGCMRLLAIHQEG